MNLYQITFSPTGGKEKVASILANVWKKEVKKINLLKSVLATELNEDDICIIAVPAYGGRVPDLATKHLKMLKGNGAKAILVAVFGNRKIDDTLAELQDIIEEIGFQCVAGVEAVAEHSLIRQFAAGRPDVNDAKELEIFALQIKNMLEYGKENLDLRLPGNRPYREYGGSALKPVVNEMCNGCGLCVKECPVSAISVDDPRVLDAEKCISCMRCEMICPQKARSLDKEKVAMVAQRLQEACSGRKENRLYI